VFGGVIILALGINSAAEIETVAGTFGTIGKVTVPPATGSEGSGADASNSAAPATASGSSGTSTSTSSTPTTDGIPDIKGITVLQQLAGLIGKGGASLWHDITGDLSDGWSELHNVLSGHL
jgi:hypothetical protein